jgi:stress-induced morphogen
VRSNAFRGLRLLEQHRLVKHALDDKLRDRTLHALTLQTQTLD